MALLGGIMVFGHFTFNVPMDALRARAREVLFRTGQSQNDVAQALQVDQSSVSRFLSGKTTRITFAPAFIYKKGWGWT